MTELKKCPFCGSDPKYLTQIVDGWFDGEYRKIFYVVGCENCEFSFRSEVQQEVFDKWNKRTEVNK